MSRAWHATSVPMACFRSPARRSDTARTPPSTNARTGARWARIERLSRLASPGPRPSHNAADLTRDRSLTGADRRLQPLTLRTIANVLDSKSRPQQYGVVHRVLPGNKPNGWGQPERKGEHV